MELTVLGCGDAFGNGGRNNTSFLITEGDEHVLIDCGASTLIRLKHEKIALEDISTIVISHFHGDHFGGIPFILISSLFEKLRKNPLTIIGPKDVEKRVMDLQEAMYAGTTEELHNIDLKFMEYQTEESLCVGDKTIKAWKAEHSAPSFPHAIRLEWKGKSIAFSGDTSWTDNLIPLSRETDLFICECNFQKEVNFGHLSYDELMEKHLLFETKSLWLNHMADEVFDANDFKLNRMYDGQRLSF
ncbi:MBL fold metallo-hydrolase [Ekhidna sp. To15]|uniref:MBL fold metallo-hydrolase n=1 Tax=Ekhidna sp. To15 TaxID=3395267 RepID=UPI003F51FA4E